MLPISDNIPHRRSPYVNYTLIGTCVAVYLYQLLHPHLVGELAYRPAYLLTSSGLALGASRLAAAALATMFLHGGLLHLGFNMWTLWIFGDNVEDRMGHWRYLVFYVLCGFAATLMHTLAAAWGLPRNAGVPMVGASGAIAGVLGAYFKLFPRATIRTLVILVFLWIPLDLPAVVFIGLWFVLQLLSGLGSLAGGSSVAFWAHVGGFLAGLLLVGLFVARRRRPQPPRVTDIRWE